MGNIVLHIVNVNLTNDLPNPFPMEGTKTKGKIAAR